MSHYQQPPSTVVLVQLVHGPYLLHHFPRPRAGNSAALSISARYGRRAGGLLVYVGTVGNAWALPCRGSAQKGQSVQQVAEEEDPGVGAHQRSDQEPFPERAEVIDQERVPPLAVVPQLASHSSPTEHGQASWLICCL